MQKLEKVIGIDFKNTLLLKEALTHRSYLNEHNTWPTSHNERLEFLGDAVLELIVTDFLFKKFVEFDEGKLTGIRAALVNHNMLLRVANEIHLENQIFLSKGENHSSDKSGEAIYANAVEALTGAIYIDQGYEMASQFIKRFILSKLELVMNKELYNDPKSMLQEIIQEQMKVTPWYKILDEKGPDHKKEFLVGVFFDNKLGAEGIGQSKQDAERMAAKHALDKLNL